ncbi:MAG: hypothetical protein ABFR53_06500, partial [Actinomycetota bacterium]
MMNDQATPPADRVSVRPVRVDDLPWMARVDSDPVAVGEHNWAGEPRVAAEVEGELRARFEQDGLVGPR